jgi:hypothetical protein
MNFKHWLLSEERILNEDFKTQREKFIQQGIEPERVDYYLNNFEIFTDKKYKEINDPIKGLEHIKDKTNIDAYKTFQELKILVDYVKFEHDRAERNKPVFNTEKDLKIKKELDNLFNEIEKINSSCRYPQGFEKYYPRDPNQDRKEVINSDHKDFFRAINPDSTKTYRLGRLIGNFLGMPYIPEMWPKWLFLLYHKLGKSEGIIKRIKQHPCVLDKLIEQFIQKNKTKYKNLSKEKIKSDPSLLDKVIQKWIKNAMNGK